MKKNISQALLFVMLLCHISAYSQLQIATNGSFENGSPLPNTLNPGTQANETQLDNCTGWAAPLGSTGDWWTDENYANAMRGVYSYDPITQTDAQVFTDIASGSYPILQAHTGNFYGGFGSTEEVVNTLSQPTEKNDNSQVMIDFWYSPRGTIRNVSVGVGMYDATLQQVELQIGSFNIITNGPSINAVPGQWYHYNSGWVTIGSHQYTHAFVGGIDPNPAGAMGRPGYIYIDDFTLYNGLDCCPVSMNYQQTSTLPPSTSVADYIAAGNDVNNFCNCFPTNDNVRGNVTVQSGQSVTFKAGNNIFLAPGFTAAQGSNFNASISSCNPSTQPGGESIIVPNWTNVFTPNGMGIDVDYCLQAYGAETWKIQVFNRFGTLIFINNGIADVNPLCMWDGTLNRNNQSGLIYDDPDFCTVDGTYFAIITLTNCSDSISHPVNIQILGNPKDCGNSGRVLDTVNQSKPKQSINSDSTVYYGVSPNPSNGLYNVMIGGSNYFKNITISDMLGRIVYQNNSASGNQIKINLTSSAAGVYILRSTDENGKQYINKLIKN